MNNIYKQPHHRKQQLLFPPSIDEYVSEDNQARAIDDYVEILDMVSLGFTNSSLCSSDGQPAYHPRLLLKIYIYSYLNKIRSSRKIETEIKRNIELMWLCSGLTPGYKTIANFRKDNAGALKKVFREFVLLCRELDLIGGKLVAVDGAFLRANASKNKLIMKKSLKKEMERTNHQIEAYLSSLSFADKEDKKTRSIKLPTDGFDKMKKAKAKLDKDLSFLEEMGLTQYNRTDPDAKNMSKPAHNLMAYNVQIAVDDKFKFIAVTDISLEGNDLKEIHTMSKKVQELVKNDAVTITADKGYAGNEQIKKCIDDKIDIVIPLSKAGQTQGCKGKYKRGDFTYDEQSDCYICPNHQKLANSIRTINRNGKIYFTYKISSKICKSCPLKNKCLSKTPSKELIRWEHQGVIESYSKKMNTDEAKAIIKRRGSIAEHPFGTIKQTLGWSHFLVRGKEKVSGENALIMFTYNFRRLLNLIGITLFKKLIIAIKEGDMEAIRAEIAAYINHLWSKWSSFMIGFMKSVFPAKRVAWLGL